MLIFVGGRRSGNVNRLMHMFAKFIEHERAIIQCRRQTESKINQRLLARPIAIEHAANLGNAHVRFVHDQQKIIGEVIKQCPRRLSSGAAIHVAAVVFDARAVAQFFHDFKIVHGALFESRCFQHLAVALQDFKLILKFKPNVVDCGPHFVGGGDKVFGREDFDGVFCR